MWRTGDHDSLARQDTGKEAHVQRGRQIERLTGQRTTRSPYIKPDVIGVCEVSSRAAPAGTLGVIPIGYPRSRIEALVQYHRLMTS